MEKPQVVMSSNKTEADIRVVMLQGLEGWGQELILTNPGQEEH